MIALGCDHGGYPLMQEVIVYLEKEKIPYHNFGTNSLEACDYPPFARAACNAVLQGECEKAVLICGTGIGMSIVANRMKGIRAAVCGDCFCAKACREHNDANVLAMGARVTGAGLALEILKLFLETPFSNAPRHMNRISQIDAPIGRTL